MNTLERVLGHVPSSAQFYRDDLLARRIVIPGAALYQQQQRFHRIEQEAAHNLRRAPTRAERALGYALSGAGDIAKSAVYLALLGEIFR